MKRLTIAALLALLVGVAGVSAQSGFLVNGIQQLVNAVTITATSQFLAPTGNCTTAPGFGFTAEPTTGICQAAAGELEGYTVGVGRFGQVDSGTFQLKSDVALAWSSSTLRSSSDARLRRTATKTLTFDDGAGGAAAVVTTGTITSGDTITVGGSAPILALGTSSRTRFRSTAAGNLYIENTGATHSIQYQVNGTPTCSANCGTSPSVSGSDSSFTVTMGATGSPASGFVATFNGTWSAAPQCTVNMGLTGMASGKLPLTVVTTTTTVTVVTNGTAPANSDVYHFQCSLGS